MSIRKLTAVLVVGALLCLNLNTAIPAQMEKKPVLVVLPLHAMDVTDIEARQVTLHIIDHMKRRGDFIVLDFVHSENALQDLGQDVHSEVDRDTAIRAGRKLSADKVITGTLAKDGDAYKTDLEAIDVAEARVESTSHINSRLGFDELPTAMAALLDPLVYPKPGMPPVDPIKVKAEEPVVDVEKAEAEEAAAVAIAERMTPPAAVVAEEKVLEGEKAEVEIETEKERLAAEEEKKAGETSEVTAVKEKPLPEIEMAAPPMAIEAQTEEQRVEDMKKLGEKPGELIPESLKPEVEPKVEGLEPEEIEPEPEKPVVTMRPAVAPKPKKGGFPWLIGALAAGGGIAVAVLAGGGGSDRPGNGGSQPPPPPPPQTGTIQVNSNPTGAKIFHNGSDTGRTTNSTLTNVSPGTHTIKLVREGYVDVEAQVTVTAGQTATMSFSLAKHTITVTAPVAGAVWIPGEEVEIRWTTGGSAALAPMSTALPIQGAGAMDGGLAAQRAAVREQILMRRAGVREGTLYGGFADDRVDSGKTAALRERAGGRTDSSTGWPHQNIGPDDTVRSDQGASTRVGGAWTPDYMGVRFVPPSAAAEFAGDLISGNTYVQDDSRVLILSNVGIKLYRGSTEIRTIISSTNNTGSFKWTIPSDQTEGTDYKIRVFCADATEVYGDSPVFKVEKRKRLMSLSRTSINFSAVTVGQTASQSFTISNSADSTDTLSGSVSISGDRFSITSGAGSFSLSPGQSKTVTARFSPPSAGNFSGSVSITHNATNRSSPASVQLSGTGVQNSTITATLKNIDGNNAPPAGTRFLLSTSPTLSISGSNPGTISGVPPGTYVLEGYQTGTFFGEEFWHSQNVTATSGQTVNVTLTRTYPFGVEVVFKKTSDGSVIGTKQAIVAGTEVRAEVTIRNNVPGTSLRVRTRVLADISRSSPYNYDSAYSSQKTISGGGGQETFIFTFRPTTLGQYHRAIDVQSLLGGNWQRTDSWDWYEIFNVVQSSSPTSQMHDDDETEER